MALTIDAFLSEHNVNDVWLSSYNDETRHMIAEILNGKISDYINSENGIALLYIGHLYKYIKKDNELAEKFYLLSVEQKNSNAMNYLGRLYLDQHKLDLVEKYFLMAAKHNNLNAMNNLGAFYTQKKQFKLAEKFYLLAAEQNHVYAMHGLASLYEHRNKPELAEKYYLMAIKRNDTHAMNNLAVMYEKQNKFDLSEKLYFSAIEHNSPFAMNNLGQLYKRQKKFDLAIQYYLMALTFYMNIEMPKKDIEKTLLRIVKIIPNVSREQQLEILEVVPQIRSIHEYFIQIPNTVHFLFTNKKVEMARRLYRPLNDDLVDICLSYY